MLQRLPGGSQAVGLAVGFAGRAAIAAPSLAEGSTEAIGVVLVLGRGRLLRGRDQHRRPPHPALRLAPGDGPHARPGGDLDRTFGVVGLAGSSFAWGSLAAIVALGSVGTGVAFVLMGRLVARVGSSRASFATYLIPVVALVLGAVFLDESVRALSIVGIALVITGAVLASRTERGV